MSSPTPELIPLSGTKMFRAGAGAGKTTRLVKEVTDFYKSFVETHKREPRIVLTTFTRKATQEMRERLMVQAQKIGDEKYLQYILSPGLLHISTIHGVLQNFLKHYGHLINLDPAFKTAGAYEGFVAASRVMKQVLLSSPEFELHLENFEFKELVQFGIKFFETKLADPEAKPVQYEDFRTFTATYLQELKLKLEAVEKNLLVETSDKNYLQFASQLNQVKEYLEIESWLKNQNKAVELIDGISKPRKTKTSQVSEATEDDVKNVLQSLRDLTESDYDPVCWAVFTDVFSKLNALGSAFFDAYYEFKLQSGQLAMSDLELFALELARLRPDAAQNFNEQWDYWLIDEFQDTSPLQIQILESLIQAKPHFIVGDPQQSIYFFRGARKQVFEDQIQKTKSKNGTVDVLDVNYRSQFELMMFFNNAFGPIGFHKMKSSSEPDVDRKKIAEIFRAEKEDDEITKIIFKINELIELDVPLEQIAVITRKNSDLKKIAQKLNSVGVPAYLHSALGFNQRREILDALSFLKFLVNPFDNKNLVQLLRSPWFYVSDAKLAELLKPKKSFWQLLEPSIENPIQRLKKYLNMAYEMGVSRTFEKGIFDCGLLDCSYDYDPTGRYESNLWKLIVQLRTSEHRVGFNYIDFINRFVKEIQGEKEDEDSDAVSAVEPKRVNLMTVHVSKGLEFDHVLLPFMGGAPQTTKTLAFAYDPANHLWGQAIRSETDLKLQSTIVSKAYVRKMRELELEENDRLLYVAMTRAKRSVFMSYSGDVKKESWFSRLSFDLTPGVHETDEYIYEVTSELPTEELIYRQKEQSKKINKQFLPTDQWTFNKKSEGVTSLLDEKGLKSAQQIVAANQAAEEGTLIHRLFELLHTESEEAVLELASKWGGSNKKFETALENLKSAKEIPMMNLIKNGNVEWGFTLKGKHSAIEGKIDLWGEHEGKIWIVDYKTGSPQHKEKAFKQLQFYSYPIRKISDKEINLVVAFPFHNQFFVKPAMTLAQLKKEFAEII